MLDRLLEVLQMLSILYAAVSNNLQRNNTILVLGRDELHYLELLESRSHSAVVFAGLEDKVGEGGEANRGAVNGEVHGDVAQVESHDGGVRDDDVADHVGAIGELVLGTEEDLDVLDAEAGELVETWGR